MPILPKETHLAPRKKVTFRSIASGAMLVDLDTGACYQLNRVGADLWTKLAGGASIGAAIDMVQQQYDAPADVIEIDSLRLCGELLDSGLVEHVPEDERP